MTNNIPAFPALKYETRDDHGQLIGEYASEQGMTLRDWFAGMALNGMLSYSLHEQNGNWSCNADHEGRAKDAYAQADAMLEQRSKE